MFPGEKGLSHARGPPHSHLCSHTYSHTQPYPSGCIQRVAEEGLQGPCGQGRQQLRDLMREEGGWVDWAEIG